jgi:DNA polymerase III delta prime subunit
MRFKTIKNVIDKTYDILPLKGVFQQALGAPESNGLWLIYGKEKHGKTTISLILANYLSTIYKTLFVMAEQGFDADFQKLILDLNIDVRNKNLLLEEYIPIDELDRKLKLARHPKIVLLDNITVYADELKNGRLRRLISSHNRILFILIAHEDKGQPYTATGKLAKKLARRIIHVEGLSATVEGRTEGGMMRMDQNSSTLYWGND